MFDVNGEYIFKFPRDGYERMCYDIIISEKMREVLGEIVPVYSLISEGEMPIAGYRKINGVHITSEVYNGSPLGLNPKEIAGSYEKVASQLAWVLNRLHSVSTREKMEAIPEVPNKINIGEEYRELFRIIRKDIFPAVDRNIQANIADSFNHFLEKVEVSGITPAFIHGDFGGWNILFDVDSLNINGVIDWTGSRIGDPALDFSELLYDFGPEVVSLVKDHYLPETDAWFWERVNFYLSLEGVHDMLQSGKQEFIDRGLERIRKNFSGNIERNPLNKYFIRSGQFTE